MNTSATINGKYYSQRTSFTARTNFTGKAASDGTGANSTVTVGTTYTFLYYNPGSRYPYAIGLPGYGNQVRCWVQTSVFPYATYSVKYNANGGSGAPGAQTKTWNSNLKLSGTKPTRTGYTFQGWATSASGGAVYAAGGIYTANAAITLYAVWKINTYGVNYNANGGSGAPGNQTKTYGQNLVLSSAKPTRTGYTFLGWATSASGGVVYKPGATYTGNAQLNLYAVWQINTYTVAYNANGGSGAPGNQTKTYGKNLVLSSTKPTKTGYTFIGWAVSSTGSVAYSAGATYTANAAITLYAVWQANTYTVRFNANGGSGNMGSQTYTYGVTKDLNANLFTKAGHTFKGWATTPGGIKVYDDGAKVKNLTSAQGGVVDLYAVWQANTYTITFNASRNGGTGDTTQQKTYGTKFGTLPTATKKYYVFQGWYTAAVGGVKITENTIVEKDITVYAQYIIDASVYIKAGGVIKPGFPYIWHNGSWKKGYTYVWTRDGWQQGLSE